MTTALVTGATQGLGLALVQELVDRLSQGDVVYLTGRGAERIEQALGRLTPGRAQVRTELLDVSADDSVLACASRLAERHGWIDIVISNAYSRVLPDDRPADVIERYVATNNLGTTRILRAFAPILADRGTLLVISSTLGTLHHLAPVLHKRFERLATLEDADGAVLAWSEAVKSGSAYSEAWPAFINIPSKVAQVAAVRALARSHRERDLERDVLLACVCPGMIDTGASRPWFDMSGAQTPTQAAAPVIDLALRSELDPAMYGELIRFGQVVPWRP